MQKCKSEKAYFYKCEGKKSLRKSIDNKQLSKTVLNLTFENLLTFEEVHKGQISEGDLQKWEGNEV